jgi:hypothetical protein
MDPELAIEWILPGGAVLSPLRAPLREPGSPALSRFSLLPLNDGGGRISFFPFAL